MMVANAFDRRPAMIPWPIQDPRSRLARYVRKAISGAFAAPIERRFVSAALAVLPVLLVGQTIPHGPSNAPSRTPKERDDGGTAVFAQAPPKAASPVFAPVDPETARALNAAVPFAALGEPAVPFRMSPRNAEFARAQDCLASAVLYEAGGNRRDQAAVAQVVLNRVRHPAFPHSVCAVVYQGAERRTGCQFTFTCDGAMARMPSPRSWERARATASAFLAGEVDPAVGMATHYHTDWVHPYWSTTLDKVARIDTHLFFRWRGTWGRAATFTSVYAGVEPIEPRLALLSMAHRAQSARQLLAEGPASAGDGPPGTAGTMGMREGDHFILVDGGGDGTGLAMQSLRQCEGQAYCKIVGWDRRSQGYGSPQNPVIRTVAFLYVSDKRTGVELVLWDCARFNRPSDTQCLSDRNRRWIGFQGDLSHAS